MRDALFFRVFKEERFQVGSSPEKSPGVSSYRGLCTEINIDRIISLVDINPFSAAENLGRYLADDIAGKIIEKTEPGSRVIYPECFFLFEANCNARSDGHNYAQTEAIADNEIRTRFLEGFSQKYAGMQERRK